LSNFHRYYFPNAVVFISCVTQDRNRFLLKDDDVQLFFETSKKVQKIYPFRLLAYVIMPDHFHWLIKTENDDGNFSNILHSLKRNFTRNYKKSHGISTPLKLWQSRFWDHVIRSEDDLENHVNYIHWNPVKHGYVKKPEDWLYSTFSHWLKLGFYGPEWGLGGEPSNLAALDFE
jgi:putative transposase